MQKAEGKPEIRISQALTYIHTSTDDFLISFLTVSGKKRVKRVRLGVPPSLRKINFQVGNQEAQTGKAWNHHINKSHNLILFDVEAFRPFELKICMLMGINNLKIRWHNGKR